MMGVDVLVEMTVALTSTGPTDESTPPTLKETSGATYATLDDVIVRSTLPVALPDITSILAVVAEAVKVAVCVEMETSLTVVVMVIETVTTLVGAGEMVRITVWVLSSDTTAGAFEVTEPPATMTLLAGVRNIPAPGPVSRYDRVTIPALAPVVMLKVGTVPPMGTERDAGVATVEESGLDALTVIVRACDVWALSTRLIAALWADSDSF
mmetsp:Transcript_20903/g.48845  ORF Transcript_20903/g.48845 Transcript_20903/m.48845 type:complete len:210 (-) Transcript_20903:9120-9749(-)